MNALRKISFIDIRMKLKPSPHAIELWHLSVKKKLRRRKKNFLTMINDRIIYIQKNNSQYLRSIKKISHSYPRGQLLFNGKFRFLNS